ncbi:MAG: hypothetical protein WC498_03245 [Candidatus Saccharimonadales bacterium]
MTKDPNLHDLPAHDPEEWLPDEAHGDEALLSLLREKEAVGERKANLEIELYEARSDFDNLNQRIAHRLGELGLTLESPEIHIDQPPQEQE